MAGGEKVRKELDQGIIPGGEQELKPWGIGNLRNNCQTVLSGLGAKCVMDSDLSHSFLRSH